MNAIEFFILCLVVIGLLVAGLLGYGLFSFISIRRERWKPMIPYLSPNDQLVYAIQKGRQKHIIASIPPRDANFEEKQSLAESECTRLCHSWNSSTKLLRR